MNKLASRSELYAQMARETETRTIHDNCPETNQDNIDRHIRDLAKVSNSSTLRPSSARKTVSSIQPAVLRKFARRSPSPHRRRWRFASACAVHALRPVTTFLTLLPSV